MAAELRRRPAAQPNQQRRARARAEERAPLRDGRQLIRPVLTQSQREEAGVSTPRVLQPRHEAADAAARGLAAEGE